MGLRIGVQTFGRTSHRDLSNEEADELFHPNGGRDWHQVSIRLTPEQWRALNRLGEVMKQAPAAIVRERIKELLIQTKSLIPED